VKLEFHNIAYSTSYKTGSNEKYLWKFYVVSTVHFGMKMYNDQRNAQIINLFIYYFYLTCLGLSIRPSPEAGVQFPQCLKSAGYDVSTRTLKLLD
jgi:hypothetical protein